ncbi:MAG: hypothetical protein ACI8P9_003265 [Parasphingorhabdus sp.]|jgi:hypothetical protein
MVSSHAGKSSQRQTRLILYSLLQIISSYTEYPAKVRGVFHNQSWKLDIASGNVEKLPDWIDVRIELSNQHEALAKMKKVDGDGSVQACIRQAIIEGHTIQKAILEFTEERHFAQRRVRQVLKLATNSDTGVQWLECHRQGEKNALVYELLDARG